MLIDPHDQKAISEALLKLVAEKSLWLECRKNGLKNIHRFSWPEHCRNYLSHVEHCRSRHPTALLDIAPHAEEPLSDSLRDVEDLSIRFSVDVDADLKINGDLDSMARQKAVVDALTRRRPRPNQPIAVDYSPGRRKRLFLIALDCYGLDGEVTAGELSAVVTNVMEAGRSGLDGQTGFVLLTGSTLTETIEVLRSCHVSVEDFDAVVCGAGSEMYYPWRDLVADVDYGAHIEYRWPGENLKSVVLRLAKMDGGDEGDMAEDNHACNSRCNTYAIKAGAKVSKITKTYLSYLLMQVPLSKKKKKKVAYIDYS